MISGNRGEWSELYTFLRVLSEGEIHSADADLNNLPGAPAIPVLKAIRQGKGRGMLNYITGPSVTVTDSQGTPLLEIDSNKMREKADYLYSQMMCAEFSSSGAFELPEVEEFMNELHLTSLKAPSESKTDITLQIHDSHTGTDSTCGWSIKSEIGAAPTLLNASAATNIVYRVIGVEPDEIDRINSIGSKSKVIQRIQAITAAGGRLEFLEGRDTFIRNLRLIDSMFPQILAEALVIRYGERVTAIKDIVRLLEERDPFFLGPGMYEYKFKKFLSSIALGMVPGKNWDGRDDANGGYIVVRKDGKVVAFHIYNRDSFEDYLFEHTKFDTPSTSRHHFGELYQKEDMILFDLNLQVRFI